ncbi:MULTISPECIES: asparagine synthase (glutamine-hydrolyzing) [unclassified Mesorhizobium]|uniref:asparagine synthase (glutamine-hydrolyzing) n=2 Tax=Mesorhizobium TaxID=68287 RepID=UPI000FE6FCB8|nr:MULTISPECIES: asparagine synthase (glutamine-hydrolyzing) [unclassified Mesorhizobium]RWE84948.1 MAG: asparagine synthase (glutamine-hydrolyzing) [Mesorhizobium sp.]TGQ93128.1 asparagine synthase (glutamine-hydrolyzing) [Mesorhizobium sp. M8A.F.Ca.ET.208.01.1.1]TGT53031.1 asparagine synthase (glutamine-hydrolyzing) [Mesorhizobium sp. M8A.F.Ca.ET.167.01.1.1]TIR04619.1 MAG: asparagine synthase (glutamine-hydrolyzing) [Mesorhizobium sp.]
MCGICGWIDFDRDLGCRDGRKQLADMTATMAKRGPDDDGTWIDGAAALGHRRLAIIDLQGGCQPMTLQEDGRPALVLVYTGETYNYTELRQRLAGLGHRFDTSSDTEVVLHAHREWGHRDPRTAVSELNGMFAYALWDTAKRELLLVRDRLGIKPLYYYQTKHGVLFGSEPKAILANSLAERAIDLEGLRRALCSSSIADPYHTVFRGMREVQPGHIARVSRGGIQQMKYWQLTDNGHTDNVPTTVRRVRELLDDTIQRQLVADVPLCTLLSGGLDSSAMTALASCFSEERIRSFALDFVGQTDNFIPGPGRPTPDGPYVQEVVKFVGTDHTDIMLSAEELMDPKVRAATLHARDLPLTLGDLDSSLYLLFRAIRQHSTVALSGEGADELFGGYTFFHDHAQFQRDTFPWYKLGDEIALQSLDTALIEKLDLPGYVDEQYRRALAEVPALTGPASTDRNEHRMREVCYLALTRYLPTLLDRKDRLSMALGLEVRVPYCDHRLVEYVFGTPWAYKTFDKREKSLLRAATADLLPQSVVQRVKSGYPAIQDPTYNTMLRERFTALLDDRNATVAPLLSVDGSRALLDTTGDLRGVEPVLALQDFLTDYKVGVTV